MVERQFGYIGYFDRESCDLDEFKVLTSQNLDAAAVPHAAAVEKNVPLYDMAELGVALEDTGRRRALLAEWAWVLGKSTGIIALKGAYPDTAPVDRATEVFNAIIAEERKAGAGRGDHFAASGQNDRIWNALQKQCLKDPEGFAAYWANTAIAAASEAWLGPNYQMTAQVNQVRPRGKAQQPHRDYHLGFMSVEDAISYPLHVHGVSPQLTLQGAVAHCDMPLESGPTKLLPFSQLYGPGYVCVHDEAHRAVFDERHIQLELRKGDALFFNPAIFHAAGENVSADINRMANLLQVGSAFGRSIEAVDRKAMCQALYPALARLKGSNEMDAAQMDAAVAACAEGYAFPTNLDTDLPVGGLAPESQATVMRRALAEGWTEPDFNAALAAMSARQAA